MFRWSHSLALSVVIFLSALPMSAQSSACQAPVLRPTATGLNLFSDKQEMDLAAVLHRQVEQDVMMIEDEALTGELQRVGDRLAQSFPKTGIKFHYYVVDIPQANAFSQSGGNIYFSRKLIAFLRNEDELAGVMAHEMGHIVTHQGTIEISRQMRSVLGITQLSDSDDIEQRYNELLDSYRKKPGAFRHKDSEEHDQLDADQVSVYALGAAGYDVKSLSAFWDRFTENKGKKGNFLTDMFGGTTEEQRRFRDMLKNASALSPECIGKHSELSPADFKKWQTAVLTYDGIGHSEKLHGLISRKSLNPPLRSELVRVKVSSDGKYILAQDQSSITVLDRQRLEPMFRIDADDARSVQFSEDSKQITFYTLELFSSPRIEIWDVAEHVMHAAYELRIPHGCNQAALSPNGQLFACISPSEVGIFGGVPMNLRVMNVETGDINFEKKGFFTAQGLSLFLRLLAMFDDDADSNGELLVGAMKFSPDSKYLLFGRPDLALAFETASGAKYNLPTSIKNIMQGDYSFMDANRIVGVGGDKGEKGAMLKFPTGEVIYSNLMMGLTHIDGAAKGDFVLLHPLKEYAVGVFDPKQNKYLIASKRPAVAIYEGEYIRERMDGELATFDLGTREELKKVDLKEGPLGRITAATASDDLNFVALSGTVRGAVWNVDKGTRAVHLRRFNAIDVDNSGFALADFPVEGEAKRQFALIDTAKNSSSSFEEDPDSKMTQAGPYLLTRIPAKKGEFKKNVNFQVKSIRTNAELWHRNFNDGTPSFFVSPENDSLVFVYDVNDQYGKAAIQGSEELRARVQALKTREHAYVMESVDLKTGKSRGFTAIDTGKGSFRLRDAFFAGRNLVVADTQDRVQVFGFDGTREVRFQSHGAVVSNDGRLLAASIGRGKVAIYDLEKFRQVEELDFASKVSMARFSKACDRLLVVTRDQKVYYFDTKQLLSGQQVASAK
jgi:hypothetical protein